MSYVHGSSKLSRAVSRVVYSSKLPSKTKTSFASEADINVIVGRFLKTGLLPSSPNPPSFLDTTLIPVGSDALMAVRAAALAFEALPLSLRKELDHDPMAFEGWLKDPANMDRAIKLGLLIPREGNAGAPAGAPAPGSGGAGAGAPAEKVVAPGGTKS